MYYAQVKKACERKNITVTALLKYLNLSTANTGKWKNGGTPSAEVLGKIADYLDVSVDFLLGRTDKPEVNK